MAPAVVADGQDALLTRVPDAWKGPVTLTRAPYGGPSVFGFETDIPLRRAAQICVHTSPLATLGGKDAGGMNVYVRELSCHLAKQGLPIDIFTRRTDSETPEVRELAPGVNVIAITAGPPEPIAKNDLFPSSLSSPSKWRSTP